MKYFVLIGIGGSNLGAKAVYEALRKPEPEMELLCADTVSPVTIERIIAKLKQVKKEDVVLNYVSKSGTTLESKINFELLKEYAGEIVVTTDRDSDIAKLGYKVLEIPKETGGRFSVFTAVATYPLEMLGFDMKEFLRGKAEADEAATEQSAKWLFDQLQGGKTVHDMFLFNPELESLGKWYRQLMGESTGKNGMGYLPTVSIGSTDLHSMYQRYIGGPRNIATTFVFARHVDDDNMAVIYEAVKKPYAQYGLPFQEYSMPALNAYELGKFMEMKMREIVHLAHFMGVNAFDQPDVESYKKLVRSVG